MRRKNLTVEEKAKMRELDGTMSRSEIARTLNCPPSSVTKVLGPKMREGQDSSKEEA